MSGDNAVPPSASGYTVGGAGPSFNDGASLKGSPLQEIMNPVQRSPGLPPSDSPWATAYALPSQIMAAIDRGVNIFRLPMMPQNWRQIATGWAKEGIPNGEAEKAPEYLYKAGNCQYMNFYMTTVDFILQHAYSGVQPADYTPDGGVGPSDWQPKDVVVIIDCHVYQRWSPMNIPATAGALDPPPSLRYSMNRDTDMMCPYGLDNTGAEYMNTALGGPAQGWAHKSGDHTPSPIQWDNFTGNTSNTIINVGNVQKYFCTGKATTPVPANYKGQLEDVFQGMNTKQTPPTYCTDTTIDGNKCYGGPTKTVLGINCTPILWYNLLTTKFVLCQHGDCIPTTAPPPCRCFNDTGVPKAGFCCKSQTDCHQCTGHWITPTPGPTPTQTPPTKCSIIDNYVSEKGLTLSDYLRPSTSRPWVTTSNIWLDLMNEPNEVNTRDIGRAYGKVVKLIRYLGINNKLVIEGNYWAGLHAQMTPDKNTPNSDGVTRPDSSSEGWFYDEDTPPTSKAVETAHANYKINHDKTAFMEAIKNSPAEIIRQEILRELGWDGKSPPDDQWAGDPKGVTSYDKAVISLGDWALNLHQYMDDNSTGGHACVAIQPFHGKVPTPTPGGYPGGTGPDGHTYPAMLPGYLPPIPQPTVAPLQLIDTLAKMEVFTNFKPLEVWSTIIEKPMVVTEFGAQLYAPQGGTRTYKPNFPGSSGPPLDDTWHGTCDCAVSKSGTTTGDVLSKVKDINGNLVCSAGCETRMNLFVKMIEQSEQILGWCLWRGAPPVSWANAGGSSSNYNCNTRGSIIGSTGTKVYGWSNAIIWQKGPLFTTPNDTATGAWLNTKDNLGGGSGAATAQGNCWRASAELCKAFTETGSKDDGYPLTTAELWALKGKEASSNFNYKVPTPTPGGYPVGIGPDGTKYP